MGQIKWNMAEEVNKSLHRPAPRIYAGDDDMITQGYMDSGNYMNSSGEYDVSGPIRNLRQNIAQGHQQRLVKRGVLPPPGGGNGGSPIKQAVDTAEALEKAQAISDRDEYNFPASLGIVAPVAFAAAASVNNGVGITPPREFFLEKIVILGADLLSIERFEVMGIDLTYGTGSVTGTQFRTDTTVQMDFNLVLDTTPIIFSGTCLVAGVIGVTMIGYLRKVRGRRG